MAPSTAFPKRNLERKLAIPCVQSNMAKREAKPPNTKMIPKFKNEAPTKSVSFSPPSSIKKKQSSTEAVRNNSNTLKQAVVRRPETELNAQISRNLFATRNESALYAIRWQLERLHDNVSAVLQYHQFNRSWNRPYQVKSSEDTPRTPIRQKRRISK